MVRDDGHETGGPVTTSSDPAVGDPPPETRDAPARRKPSAGRNLPAAIGTGLLMGGVVLASLFIVKQVFVAVAAFAVMAAVWELADAVAARRHLVPRVPLMAGAAATVVAAYAWGLPGLGAGVLTTTLAAIVWRLLAPWPHAPDSPHFDPQGVTERPPHPDGVFQPARPSAAPAGLPRRAGLAGDPAVLLRDATSSVLVVLWLPLMAGFTMLMLREDDGALRILTFVLLPVVSDTGGYAAGVFFGRHAMSPSISPKKSWEGFAGSAAAGLVAGILVVTLGLQGAWWAGALIGLTAVVTATVGDLSESVLKRDLGIKDMGSLIPGHGGVLDRIDSMLLTAPVLYLLLMWLVPVAT